MRKHAHPVIGIYGKFQDFTSDQNKNKFRNLGKLEMACSAFFLVPFCLQNRNAQIWGHLLPLTPASYTYGPCIVVQELTHRAGT